MEIKLSLVIFQLFLKFKNRVVGGSCVTLTLLWRRRSRYYEQLWNVAHDPDIQRAPQDRLCIMAPSPKEIVEAVMTFVKHDTRPVKNILREFLTYSCLKSNCSIATILFQVFTGFQNPYAHIRACYGPGKRVEKQDEILPALCNEALEACNKSSKSIKSHFKSKKISETEREIHGYISIIVFDNAVLRLVESRYYSNLSRFDIAVSSKTVREVIVKMVELVEKRIQKFHWAQKGI